MSSTDENLCGVCFGLADISFSYLFTILLVYLKNDL